MLMRKIGVTQCLCFSLLLTITNTLNAQQVPPHVYPRLSDDLIATNGEFFPADPKTPVTQAFSIVEARWGAADGWADVSSQIQGQVRHGGLFINDLHAVLKEVEDPKFGHDKALIVVYQHLGKTRLKIVASTPPTGRGGRLVLPESADMTQQVRQTLHEKLVGTKWRIERNGLTVKFEDGKYQVSDWGERKGVWLVTGPDQISGLAYEGSRNFASFDLNLETGTWIVEGKPFSRILRIPDIKPRADIPDEPLFECVLGVYGHAIRGQREPFVNLRPPHRDLWTEEIQRKLKGTLSYGQVDYIATAKLIVTATGSYKIDLPDSGTQLRLNGHLVHAGSLDLRKGAYEVEIYTNHWGQPYLKFAHAIIIDAESGKKVPFVNTGSDLEAFLSQIINDREVVEVTEYQTQRVELPGK